MELMKVRMVLMPGNRALIVFSACGGDEGQNGADGWKQCADCTDCI